MRRTTQLVPSIHRQLVLEANGGVSWSWLVCCKLVCQMCTPRRFGRCQAPGDMSDRRRIAAPGMPAGEAASKEKKKRVMSYHVCTYRTRPINFGGSVLLPPPSLAPPHRLGRLSFPSPTVLEGEGQKGRKKEEKRNRKPGTGVSGYAMLLQPRQRAVASCRKRPLLGNLSQPSQGALQSRKPPLPQARPAGTMTMLACPKRGVHGLWRLGT